MTTQLTRILLRSRLAIGPAMGLSGALLLLSGPLSAAAQVKPEAKPTLSPQQKAALNMTYDRAVEQLVEHLNESERFAKYKAGNVKLGAMLKAGIGGTPITFGVADAVKVASGGKEAFQEIAEDKVKDALFAALAFGVRRGFGLTPPGFVIEVAKGLLDPVTIDRSDTFTAAQRDAALARLAQARQQDKLAFVGNLIENKSTPLPEWMRTTPPGTAATPRYIKGKRPQWKGDWVIEGAAFSNHQPRRIEADVTQQTEPDSAGEAKFDSYTYSLVWNFWVQKGAYRDGVWTLYCASGIYPKAAYTFTLTGGDTLSGVGIGTDLSGKPFSGTFRLQRVSSPAPR